MSPEENKFIEDLYDQYGESLWRYAFVCLKDRECADELISDVFHVAAEKPEQVMAYDSSFGWLIGTLKNKIKKSKKMRQQYAQRLLTFDEKTLEEIVSPSVRPTEDQAELELSSIDDTRMKIQAALSQEELYILKRITLNKATHKAVAEELGISLWSSQKRLERIRKKLRKVFPDYQTGKKKNNF